jgi:hypothetical protein
MTAQQNQAFSKLVQAWKRREEVRSRGIDLAALVEARRELDVARLEMAQARHI